MAEETLALLVRTPEGVVFEDRVTSLRVPTDTGQVGLRPRSEPAALVVEPGLALVVSHQGLQLLATAGGLLRCDGEGAVLVTPLAVIGESAEIVGAQLAKVLDTPSPDRELRSVLQRLETGILQELRRGAGTAHRGEPLD